MSADRPIPRGRRVLPRVVCLLATFATVVPVMAAQPLAREQDIVELRLGQRIRVDDGTCPAGQIKEVSGTKMTESGITRSRKCIPRAGVKEKQPSATGH